MLRKEPEIFSTFHKYFIQAEIYEKKFNSLWPNDRRKFISTLPWNFFQEQKIKIQYSAYHIYETNNKVDQYQKIS